MSFTTGWNPPSSCPAFSSLAYPESIVVGTSWQFEGPKKKKKKEGLLVEILVSGNFILTSRIRNCWVLLPSFPPRGKKHSLLLLTECLCPLKVRRLNPQCDIIWRRGLMQVRRFRRGHEGGARMMGLVPLLEEEETRAFPVSPTCEDTVRRHYLQARRTVLIRNPTRLAP